jgi:hypothetical protein
MKNDSILEDIFRSPFILQEQYRDDFLNKLYMLRDDIKELKIDPSYSKYKVLKSMFIFSKYYETFRPVRITKNDYYFGTVKKIESIYFYLFKYLDSGLLITFSKSFNDLEYISFPNQAHKEIEWDLMITDINGLCDVILRKAEEAAVKLFVIASGYLPHYMYDLVRKYILRHNKQLTQEDIKFNYQNTNIVKVCDMNIQAKTFYEFEDAVFKIKRLNGK